MPQIGFATLMIVSSTSFFLGLLFSLFPYDYPLLWAPGPVPTTHLDAVEANLKLLYHCPKICFQIFHFMILVGLGGLIAKLYKPSESNMLFDGGSLVLFMVGVIVYISNIAKGMRIVNVGIYGVGLVDDDGNPIPEPEIPSGEGVSWGGMQGDNTVLGREDNLKVLSASNTILAFVLLGVLVLQVGQWYADRQDEKTRREFEAKEKEEGDQKAVAANSGTGIEKAVSGSSGSEKKGKEKGGAAGREGRKNK